MIERPVPDPECRGRPEGKRNGDVPHERHDGRQNAQRETGRAKPANGISEAQDAAFPAAASARAPTAAGPHRSHLRGERERFLPDRRDPS